MNSLGTLCLELLLAMKRDKTNATSRRAIRTDNPTGIITSFLAAPMLHRIAKPARIGRWQNIRMTFFSPACKRAVKSRKHADDQGIGTTGRRGRPGETETLGHSRRVHHWSGNSIFLPHKPKVKEGAVHDLRHPRKGFITRKGAFGAAEGGAAPLSDRLARYSRPNPSWLCIG